MIRTNRDYPQIIINSVPAPEMIYDKISDTELEPYIQGLKELDKFGVDFIVMVCNTIHVFYDKLQKEISTPILDLREELRKLLIRKNARTASILGTPSTVKNGLYKFDGIEYSNPTADELRLLSDAIFKFNKGNKKEKQTKAVRRVYNRYSGKADVVILGCTEFALMLGEDKNAVNTIDVLVDAVIEKIE